MTLVRIDKLLNKKGITDMSKRFGFTLAEVLITLGIIGVVAAMTIPTLMNNTGQQEFRTGFKKMISVLNQAVTMNYALESVDFSVSYDTGTATTMTSLYTMFNNRMNVSRIVDGATITGMTGPVATNYTLFFNDGMAISWPKTAKQCENFGLGTPCKALVDINGPKKPNVLSSCTAGTGTMPTCNAGTLKLSDQFGVLLFDQQVIPNGAYAREVMFK